MTSPLSSVIRCRWFLLLSNNYAQPDFHQARSSKRLQPNSHPGGRRVEDSFLNHIRALRIFGHAVRAYQHSVSLSGLHQRCLSRYAQQRVIVYIDDILVYSDSLENHIQQVRAVLQRLIKHFICENGKV